MGRCIQCGAQLALACPRCGTCGLATSGAKPLQVKMPIYVDRPVNAPAVCCCCLAPKTKEVDQQVYVAYRRFFHVKVPWCDDCRARQVLSTVVLVVGMFMVGVVGLFVPIALLGHGNLGYGLATVGFIGGLIVGAVVALQLRKLWQPPGHVPGCDAVGSLEVDGFEEGGRQGGQLAFGNQVFAQEWARFNPPS